MPLAPGAVQLPLRHLSIRVPWHDAGWDGTICRHPLGNGSCLILENIHKKRYDAAEEENAGKSWQALPKPLLPPCVGERAGFMAPFTVEREISHPYAEHSKAHQHFKPTRFTYPPFSAACIPFAWMRRENADAKVEQYGVNYDHALEAEADRVMDFSAGWIQDHRNQHAMLDTFFSAVEKEHSLCFFYAKQVPLAEASGRILIGVARVKGLRHAVEYEYAKPTKPGMLRSMLWERTVHHTLGEGDGFLLPYHQLLELAQKQPDLDLAPFVAHAPEDHWGEFSYGSEHVSHDAAIAALLICAEKLREAAKVLPGDFSSALKWIDARLNEVWKLRGPYPGLGSALAAFGVERGSFLAYEIAQGLHENEDPWPSVQLAFADPSLAGPQAGQYLGPTLNAKWRQLPDERRALLKLLSRFDLTAAQAKRFYQKESREQARIDVADRQLLENPYLLYELDRHAPDAIALATIDRGVFPDDVVRLEHPLPEPSAVKEPIDARRVRASMVSVLEAAGAEGDTLLPADHVITSVRELPLQPACALDADLLPVVKDIFSGVVVETALANGSAAYKLERLARAGKIIRDTVEKRANGTRLAVAADWAAVLDELLKDAPRPATPAEQEAEQRARQEKAAALAELAAARVSVLIGPAGTGKTTMLAALINHPAIKDAGVTLLTPTGKARVQLTQKAKLEARTIAQFLVGLQRYEPATGEYLLGGKPPIDAGKTLIIDEASMLTEEQLAATLSAVRPSARLILVGDPRQLPPIGAGRPFVDIVHRLRPDTFGDAFPRVGPSYAELTVIRRQGGGARDDLLLASWFSGDAPDPGADEVWPRIASGAAREWVETVAWNTPQELHDALVEAVRSIIGDAADRPELAGLSDEDRFGVSLGGNVFNGHVYYRPRQANHAGAAMKAESWQILTPVRAEAHGVVELNRLIQRTFRKGVRKWAAGFSFHTPKIPRPFGPEEMVYGDKVINLVNEKREFVSPRDNALQYVANGEIGMIVGEYWGAHVKKKPRRLQVEFSSQLGFSYSYIGKEFSEAGGVPLELAYALTIHRAQGSEFGVTFLILPENARMLSRELLYTALTRQRDRVVIFHQGELKALKDFGSPARSETTRRLTDLFHTPSLVEVDGRLVEERHIHRTARGEMVRSKSEVILADRLHAHGVVYDYERPLAFEGEQRIPDFTIDDAETGRVIYWEHLGLLHLPEYRDRWERKLAWYKRQGILPHDETPEGGTGGLLVVSRDDANGAIDAMAIDETIEQVFPA